jgi:hypothetical protein
MVGCPVGRPAVLRGKEKAKQHGSTDSLFCSGLRPRAGATARPRSSPVRRATPPAVPLPPP